MNVARGSVIRLEIKDDGRFDGHVGCNNYFERLRHSSADRSAGHSETFHADRRPGGEHHSALCMKEAAMVQEAAYLGNFEGTINFSVLQDGSLLRLKKEGGTDVSEHTLFTPGTLDHT